MIIVVVSFGANLELGGTEQQKYIYVQHRGEREFPFAL